MEQTRERKSSSLPVRREVPFVARMKGPSEVVLTGDFTRWSEEGIRLRKGPNDEWRTTLDLEPGEYQYRLIVDGKWHDDPQAATRVPNPYGGQNCILRVPPTRVSER
jgi:hypothetical protein